MTNIYSNDPNMANIQSIGLQGTVADDRTSKVFELPCYPGSMGANFEFEVQNNCSSVLPGKHYILASQEMSDGTLGKSSNNHPVPKLHNHKKVLEPRAETGHLICSSLGQTSVKVDQISGQTKPTGINNVGKNEYYTLLSISDKTRAHQYLEGKFQCDEDAIDLKGSRKGLSIERRDKEPKVAFSAPDPVSAQFQHPENNFKIASTESFDASEIFVDQTVEDRGVERNFTYNFTKEQIEMLEVVNDWVKEKSNNTSEEEPVKQVMHQNKSVQQEMLWPSCDPPLQQCDSEVQIGSTETTHGNRDGIPNSLHGSFWGGSVTSFPSSENLSTNQTFVENGVNANADSMVTVLTPEESMKVIGCGFPGLVCLQIQGDCSNRPPADNILEHNETTDGLQKPIIQAERIPKSYSIGQMRDTSFDDVNPQTPMWMDAENLFDEQSVPAKQRATCKARCRSSTKGKSLKKTPKMTTRDVEVSPIPVSNPNTERDEIIMNEPPQVKKRIVKGLLRDKLKMDASRKRSIENDQLPPGKRMRKQSSFSAASPMSELASQAESLLVLDCEREDGMMSGEEAVVIPQTQCYNIPNWDALN